MMTDLQAFFGGAGDGLGLAAFLGPLAGIGPGGVDQGDDRQVELVGQIHQPHGFAIALGPGHAEIAFDAGLGVMAFFVADNHHWLVVEAGQSAHDSVVIGEVAVTSQRDEFAEQSLDIVLAMRPIRVAGDLAFAPGGQVFVQVFQQFTGLLVQRGGFLCHVHFRVLFGEGAKLFGLAFDLGQVAFKVEVILHIGPLIWLGQIWFRRFRIATIAAIGR